MRHTDVVIAGGGLGGSLAAAMLGRAGTDVVLVDPHPTYPSDFRCEKLDSTQMRTLARTGLSDAVIQTSTADIEFWEARFGRVIDKRPGDQRGILYDTLVNTIRSQIPKHTSVVHAKVTGISTGPDRQTVQLSDGEEISARLVILATGLNPGVREKIGIERNVISASHSISIGFDVKPLDRPAFPFSSLTYFADRPSDRMAYITLFPIGSTMRANLFGYRDLHDPWHKQLRDAPQATLYAMWPRLRRLMGDFAVTDFIKIRPVDLYVTNGYRQDGIVLVGDAFATSCPAAGTGARKVLVDVERLCNVHVPAWLATPGMGEAKIASFYEDPVKRDCDTRSAAKAFQLRSFSTDPAWTWAAMRWAKFVLQSGRGALRRVTATQKPPAGPLGNTPAADGPTLTRSGLAQTTSAHK
jgi:2-polyprenyl-6-methoxyphenol hydroxylase-like FAD-dependent oxidoreductase